MERPWASKEKLKELYIGKGMSTREVGDELGCSKTTVRRYLHRFDIEVRTPDNEKHPRYQMLGDGRRYMIFRHNDHHVYEHRLLATLKVDDLDGFDELEVHHKVPVKWYNTLENVEPLTPEEHRKVHREMNNQIKQETEIEQTVVTEPSEYSPSELGELAAKGVEIEW